ncbi:hypothetical protein ACWFQ8_13150 [Streptomyces sp. NPDC055254]
MPTRPTVAVKTRSGRLTLVRGGAAQEFTLTLRNGNSVDHRHLLVAFRWNPSSAKSVTRPPTGPAFGRSASTRPRHLACRHPPLATEANPASLFTAGGPLGPGAVRVER